MPSTMNRTISYVTGSHSPMKIELVGFDPVVSHLTDLVFLVVFSMVIVVNDVLISPFSRVCAGNVT